MNQVIEKNKRWLKTCSVVARIVGYVLLLSPVGFVLLSSWWMGEGYWGNLGDLPILIFWGWPHFLLYLLPSVLLALLAWTVSELIRYLVESEYRPRWMLRHGDKILYLYAMHTIYMKVYLHTVNAGWIHSYWIYNISSLVPFVGKIILLIGLGLILRRVLPIIKESKTLV